MANETIRRGIAMSFMAAIVQALLGDHVSFCRPDDPQPDGQELGRAIEGNLEMLTGVFIACLGLDLLIARGWHILKIRIRRSEMQGPGSTAPHAIDCACGHTHFAQPRNVIGVRSWRSAWLLALSVGIRPCMGAYLLLVFARSQGMFWAGLLGPFAMALGTAVTVSLLAMVAAGSRELAMRVSRPAPVWSGVVINVMVLAAGIALVGARHGHGV